MIIREYLEQNRNGNNSSPFGFNSMYTSFPHYILQITEDIWEKRAIWLLYDTYDDRIVIHSGANSMHGRDSVITGTLKTLYAFPDRKMGTDAIIWAHYEDSTHTRKETLSSSNETRLFSSHRIISTATNLGTTVYGAATGKHIHFHTIADCLAKDNYIYEEWLVRDNLFVIQQLGFDAFAMAKKDTRYDTVDVLAFDDKSTPLQYTIGDCDEKSVDLVYSLYQAVEKGQSLEQLYYDEAISHDICDVTYTTNEYRPTMWKKLLNPFENKKYTIQQITTTVYEDKTEVALRWRLAGQHSHNSALFGPPTQNTANILGIHHFVIQNNRISEEWFIYDAFDTLCQLYRTT